MSNFSSIGVSVYEITHDCRLTCYFPDSGRSWVQTDRMTDTAEPDGALPPVPQARPPAPQAPPPVPAALPPALAAALAAFERFLRSERSLSPHTVRAYAGDIRSLLEHACRHGVDAPGGLDVTQLRGWLAVQHESGAARATLARRGAAA